MSVAMKLARAPSIFLVVLSAGLTVAAGACSTPKQTQHPASAAASGAGPSSDPSKASNPKLEPPPWTEAFSESTALLAAEVRIEGPPGLISHVASVSDPEELSRTEKTVPEGFLQVIEVKPEARGAKIAAQLDRLAIVALQRLIILERPGGTTVIVMAKGEVYWENPKTGEVKRGETLRLDGKVGEKTAR
jgi:hypothetical protein